MGKSFFLIYELFRLQDKTVFVQLGHAAIGLFSVPTRKVGS